MTDAPVTTTDSDGRLADRLLAGSGAMREQCRRLDWAATGLGPIEAWPASLRTATGLVLGSAFPMVLLWGESLIQLYNDGYRDVMGVKHPAGLGQRTRECWPEVWHLNAPIYARVRAGESVVLENALFPITRSGVLEDAWFTLSYSPVPDDRGDVGGVLVTVFETTAQVRAHGAREVERERLLASERAATAELRAVLESMTDAVYIGRATEITLANQAALDQVGFSSREELNRAVGALAEKLETRDASTGESIALERDAFIRALGGERVVQEILVRHRKTGEDRVVRSAAAPVIIDGRVVAAVAVNTDVTEQVLARREVERLLADSERARHDADAVRQRTEAIAQFIAALASMRSAEEVLEVMVQQSGALFGAAGTVVALLTDDGRSLELLGVRGMSDDVRRAWRKFPLDTPGPLSEVTRTGRARFLESRAEWADAYPMLLDTLDAQGHAAHMVLPLAVGDRTLGALGIAFDAARAFVDDERMLALALARQCAQAVERVQLFEAEQGARREAEAANRAKAEFLAVMSHELRTPLNAIGGYAELMEMGLRGPITTQQREDLRRVQASQRHLLGLINEVLNYAKLETGTVEFDLARAQLGDALTEAETLVAPQARVKGLLLTTAACGPELAVLADAEKLRQILVNLLSNAIKFTASGGRVTLACAAADALVHVTVQDTGIGIGTEQWERIFDPFVQVRSDLTRPHEGTGLGLAISRDLARRMGGNLSVESALGVGSTFTLTLPRA